MFTNSPRVAEADPGWCSDSADLPMGARASGGGRRRGGLVGSVIVSVSLELGTDAVDAAAVQELEVVEAAPPVADEGPLAARPQVAVVVDPHVYVLLFETYIHPHLTNQFSINFSGDKETTVKPHHLQSLARLPET